VTGITVISGGDQTTSAMTSPEVAEAAATMWDVFVAPSGNGRGRVAAMATAPRTLAIPIPRVTADIRASPCLRASCRADPGKGGLVMVCSDPAHEVRTWGEVTVGVLRCMACGAQEFGFTTVKFMSLRSARS
jgi:hypothetical protein